MKKEFAIFLSALFLVLFLRLQANASSAKIYFSSPPSAAVGSEIDVKILLDSDFPANAYFLGFSFPSDKLELLSLDDSRSIMNVWQARPRPGANGAATLAGASLAPFKGNGGEIASVRFRVLKEGSAALAFVNPLVYAADGKGTSYTANSRGAEIVLTTSSSGVANEGGTAAVADKTPPEIKELFLKTDPINPGQKIVGFLVSDSGSGVKDVEARLMNWFWWTDWEKIENPSAVKSGAWAIEISVSDNQGNISRKIVYDWQAFFRLPAPALLGLIILIATVSAFIFRRRRIA